MNKDEIKRNAPSGANFFDNKGDYYKFENGSWFFYAKQVNRFQLLDDISIFFDLFKVKPL